MKRILYKGMNGRLLTKSDALEVGVGGGFQGGRGRRGRGRGGAAYYKTDFQTGLLIIEMRSA